MHASVGPRPSSSARRGADQQGTRRALAHATRIIAVSEATAERIRAVAPRSSERVRVTHNAASSAFAPATPMAEASERAAAVVGSSAPYHLVVGKNEPYKANDVAIKAFAQAAGADELLLMVQRTGSGAGLAKLAEDLGVAHRLRWVGDASAMAAALGRLREGTLREDLRQRGLARARAFSWERTASATLEVYREAAVAGPMRVHTAAP